MASQKTNPREDEASRPLTWYACCILLFFLKWQPKEPNLVIWFFTRKAANVVPQSCQIIQSCSHWWARRPAPLVPVQLTRNNSLNNYMVVLPKNSWMFYSKQGISFYLSTHKKYGKVTFGFKYACCHYCLCLPAWVIVSSLDPSNLSLYWGRKNTFLVLQFAPCCFYVARGLGRHLAAQRLNQQRISLNWKGCS